jgi:hypothetical protein
MALMRVYYGGMDGHGAQVMTFSILHKTQSVICHCSLLCLSSKFRRGIAGLVLFRGFRYITSILQEQLVLTVYR